MLEPDDTTTASTTAAEPAGDTGKPVKKAAKKAPAKKAAKKAPAKKAVAKKAAKPAAETAPAETPVTDATATDQPAKKPARKRAPKRADAQPTDAASAAPGAESASPSMTAAGVLFMPPAAAAAPPRAPKPAKAAKVQPDRAPVETIDDMGAKGAKGAKSASGAAGAKGQPAKKTPKKTAQRAAPKGGADEPAPGDVDITAAEDIEDETAEPEDVREAAIEQASGARRRRRRGRRGRGGSAKSAEAGDDSDDSDSDTAAEDAIDGGDDAAGEASTHRTRRRRRSGEEDEGSDDPNTVTHVREPKAPDDGVKAVKGSTRLEAKRQRRKDGRDTTRRRAPILSEAEFLARREAVDRVMAVRQSGDRTQIAVLEDDILVEHYVTRASATSYVGNVYLGRVQNVLPSMEAAFVDIGKGRNGVLYAGEVNWDAAGLEGKARTIESALKSGDAVLVQVTKDPIGHKGARLTSQVSLPGRFLVYVPNGGMTGISRRLPDNERHRLKSILKKIVPEDAGVIVRTAAEGASEEDLTRDVERLKVEWAKIEKAAKDTKSAPKLVHGEPDLATRVVRDVFNEDFKKLIVQGDGAWTTVSEYLGAVAPDLGERLSRHTKDSDLFHDLRVDEQLMKALDRKVWLPSGGSLVIDRTEAMTVIDVNTGKFVGAGGNLEQTVTRNNLEAAEEIVRQLRLRDVGGIVVIDFIDMVLESNRELVLRRLTECLGRDRTKHQVAEVTSLGLVQMTRKRVGEGLLEAFSETCEVCKGRGVIIHVEPVDKPASREDDDRPASGKGKRKRGGKGAASAEKVDKVEPETSPEQRAAASAAIAAIHRAAAAEKDADAADRVDALALDLVEAVSETASTGDSQPTDEPAPGNESPPGNDSTTAPVEAAPATAAEEHPAPEVETPAADSGPPSAGQPDEADEADEAAPPKRRPRRVASRPAGPPGAA